MLGNFDFSLNLYDPTVLVDLYSDTLPITGIFNLQDIRDLPDGTSEIFYGETGILTGYISKNDYVSFKVDWIVYMADSVSAVPAPPSIWMFVIGLPLIGGMRIYKRKS